MSEIRHLISIEAPPEKTFAALATSKGLSSWWTADSKADETVGGKAEFGFDHKSVIFRMTIEKLEPGRQVVWTCHGDNPEWVGTTLTWNIEPNDGGSLLRFTQSGWKQMTDMVARIETIENGRDNHSRGLPREVLRLAQAATRIGGIWLGPHRILRRTAELFQRLVA